MNESPAVAQVNAATLALIDAAVTGILRIIVALFLAAFLWFYIKDGNPLLSGFLCLVLAGLAVPKASFIRALTEAFKLIKPSGSNIRDADE